MEYGTILAFLAVALLLGASALGVNRLLSPFRPNRVKNATYECGNEPVGDAQIRYNVRFYIFALLYVVFAVEAAFLFPWAVVFRQIAGKPRWVRRYGVVRALVFNPKTPPAIALQLSKRLSLRDMSLLGRDRNISEAVRRAARRENEKRR